MAGWGDQRREVVRTLEKNLKDIAKDNCIGEENTSDLPRSLWSGQCLKYLGCRAVSTWSVIPCRVAGNGKNSAWFQFEIKASTET